MAAKYELQDLLKFGDNKNKDPFEFMHQFDNFLRYINLNITSPAQVESAIQLFGSCMQKEARSYFETHIGPTPTNEEGVKVQRTIAEWNKIKENFIKRFHLLGRTTEQLEFKWSNLKWSPQLESIEDDVQKINQLATALGKTQPDKVLKLKMSAPNQEIYLLIMTCTTTEEIVATINKFQAMSYFLKSSTPRLNAPTTQTTNYAVAAQQAKKVSFASDTQNNIPGWAQNLENKLSDQMTKLTKSINKCTHDRYRNDTYDDRYHDSYDDRYDGHKPRYCDGHRKERDRDYENYGTYRKRYRSLCRHDPRKSERHPNCPESQIKEEMDEIALIAIKYL